MSVALQFNEQIIPSVKHPILTKTLLKRLASLYEELAAIPDDFEDPSSLNTITKSLMNRKLLRHSDYGVQSYVALCVAEILRLYAPDAPYSQQDLTEYFTLVISSIMKHIIVLPDSGTIYATYRDENLNCLARLAENSSIILLTGLPKAEKLTESLFNICYNEIGKSRHCDQKITAIVSELLSEVISESSSISQSVLKVILSRFFKSATSPTSGAHNPGYEFSVAICENNPERMSRQIAQFISEELYEISSLDVDSKKRSLDSVAFKNLQKIHKLIFEIWKAVPEILSTVVGLMDSELCADREKIRVIATKTVGSIISYQPSKLNFISAHNDTWQAWVQKTLDSSFLVRISWVECAATILNVRFELVNPIANGLLKCLLDSDERVRLATLKSIGLHLSDLLFSSKFTHNLTILKTIGKLLREKNMEVRNESIGLLAKLYNAKFDQLLLESSESQTQENETSSSSLAKLIKWIPDHLIGLIYINDKSINATTDKYIIDCVFGMNSNSRNRVQRLVFILSTLSQKSKTAFWAMNQRQVQLADGLKKFVKLAEGDISDPQVNKGLVKTISWLSSGFPLQYKPVSVLARFLKLPCCKRLCHLIKLCISTDSAIEAISNSFQEFFTKLSDPKLESALSTASELESSFGSFEEVVTTNDAVDLWKVLLCRSSNVFFNKSNVGVLMSFARDEFHENSEISSEVLEQISETVPKMFQSHVDGLVKLIIDTLREPEPSQADEDFSSLSRKSSPILEPSVPEVKRANLSNSLKTACHFFTRYPRFLPSGSELVDALVDLCIKNGTPLEAKFACRIICLENEFVANSSIQQLLGSVFPLDSDNVLFPTHLSLLSEIFLQKPEILEDKSSEITGYLIKEVLLRNKTAELDLDWITDADLEAGFYNECYSKMLSLRVFVNRLRSSGEHNEELANVVLKLLMSCIGNGGQLSEIATPSSFAARLRLYAGLMVLKLGKLKSYNKSLTPKTINRLIFLIQDEKIEVRERFVTSLEQFLNDSVVNSRYLPLIFFVAHEPAQKLRNKCQTWIKSSFKSQLLLNSDSIEFEKSFTRLLHMIAHHQEFEDLVNEAELGEIKGNEKEMDKENEAQNNVNETEIKEGEENEMESKENEKEKEKEKEKVSEKDKDELLFKAYGFAVKYILFYLENVATKENISLLYYLSSRVKQYRDSLVSDSEYSSEPRAPHVDNIYRVGDLSMLAIQHFQAKKGWEVQTFPGKIQLSKDLYGPMRSSKEAQKVAETTYIASSLTNKVESLIKSELGVRSHEKRSSTYEKRGSLQRKKAKRAKVEDPTRRSTRVIHRVNYEDIDSSDESEGDYVD